MGATINKSAGEFIRNIPADVQRTLREHWVDFHVYIFSILAKKGQNDAFSTQIKKKFLHFRKSFL